MTRKQQSELLRLIKAGYPTAAARAKLGLTRAQLEEAGIDAELAEAEEVQRGVLLAKAVEAALNGDTGALRDVLNRTGTGPLEQALNRLTIHETHTLVGRLSFEARERLKDALGGVMDLSGTPLLGYLAMLEEQDAGEPELPPLPAAAPSWARETAPARHHHSGNGAASPDGAAGPPEGISAVEPEPPDMDALRQEAARLEKLCLALRHRLNCGQDEAPGSELGPLEDQLERAQADWRRAYDRLEEAQEQQEFDDAMGALGEGMTEGAAA